MAESAKRAPKVGSSRASFSLLPTTQLLKRHGPASVGHTLELQKLIESQALAWAKNFDRKTRRMSVFEGVGKAGQSQIARINRMS
jgi:hypothetical protein